jgi:hypothetical protein
VLLTNTNRPKFASTPLQYFGASGTDVTQTHTHIHCGVAVSGCFVFKIPNSVGKPCMKAVPARSRAVSHGRLLAVATVGNEVYFTASCSF